MYQQNNIEFRIATATAISNFKNTQAHSFIQVCRKEFDFDLSSREVVLLSYDRFSSWLLKLERSFLTEHGKTPSQKMIRLAFDMFVEELRGIEKTCMENPMIFTNDICDFLKKVHSYTEHIMANAVMDAQRQSIPSAFVSLTHLVSEYLQHLLIAMHEFNNNLVLKREPFICVSRFSLLAKAPRYISLKTRAEYFRERVGKSAVFTLKNYTNEDLTDELLNVMGEMGMFAKWELLEEATA